MWKSPSYLALLSLFCIDSAWGIQILAQTREPACNPIPVNDGKEVVLKVRDECCAWRPFFQLDLRVLSFSLFAPLSLLFVLDCLGERGVAAHFSNFDLLFGFAPLGKYLQYT